MRPNRPLSLSALPHLAAARRVRPRRRAIDVAVAFAFALALGLFASPASAATAFLRGTVNANGSPVANATVTAAGNNVVVHATTDAVGRFTFAGLSLGTYEVTAASKDRSAQAHVDLGSAGVTLTLSLAPPLKEIGRIAVRSTMTHGSGSDTELNSTTLTRSPYSGSFPEALIQLPGAVRGANGVVHMNGDHGVIDYNLDGVPLPQALNREIGSEIDPNDVAFLDVIEGAYPAQYGLRFGSVLNITTRAGTGPAGFDGTFDAGSYTALDETLGYHAPIAGGGGYSIAVSSQQSSRGLDPPNFDSPHNDASNANQFVRLTLPRGNNNFTDVTMIHTERTYQIPNDVQYGEPATTDDNEIQEDTFAGVQFRQSIGSTGSFSFGPAVKVSRIQDFGDPANDFVYGEALNVLAPPFGNGGSRTGCANALRTGTFTPTTCAFSLVDDKTALDAILQSDYTRQYGNHEVRMGLLYDASRVDKNYAITLQPNNFLAPILTPQAPNGPATVVDGNPNVGNTYASYVQDSWRLGNAYTLDYGVRYDFFSIKSSDFADGFGAFSPRIKLTRLFGPRASVYAYVGRYFEPFSLENVDPHAAQLLNLPLQPTLAQFDLKPERDTQLELGGHLPLGQGALGFRVWQKNANDLIDDTQVGVTALHQDINYTLGRLSQEALTYQEPLVRNGRAYVSVAHTVSLNAGCETQLLAPCFGQPTGFTPADHDQSYSVTGGFLANDRRDGWFSMDSEYGSGLSSAICPVGTPGNCKMTPHTIFSVEKGIAVGPRVALTMRIANILNDRYYVTVLNAQGNHWAAPRMFDVGLRFGH